MKIMQGSLPLQEKEMRRSVYKLYEEVFPCYFSDAVIKELKKNRVLALPDANSHGGTLKGAFEIMACLQTITIILEERKTSEEAIGLFNRNSRMLNELGVFFPLNHEQFFMDDKQLELPLQPAQAANVYLI
ncbi:hypothetical protein CYL18_15395 [Pradoshia eiseniae]|uniref:Uncharacterized protein n=1 Tax=Pradoshia eiseniae TaxID=2064768 RepID=A0A2S7MWQ3_9BACI|nr:DUF5365 family protein [Pradoshia eiseniae]PQD94252.1 hypothetical protein CYL18_15395 [Pradoshia eiseniae]